MENRVDIMVDIETLGNETNSTIIQLSAVKFDIVTGKIIDEFNEYIDISKVKELNVTGSTLKWWLDNSPLLLKETISKGIKNEKEVISLFISWITYYWTVNKDNYLWGNGILFDNKIIQHKCISNGFNYPIFYRNDRDVRTIVELYCHKHSLDVQTFVRSFNNENYIEHNGIDDCKKQVEIVVKCYNDLMI